MNTKDQWKSTLLTVSDSAFFEIIRNYLGDLKTPFNKHDLIARLEAFLKDEAVQERIVDLIDEEEAKVVTAIALLSGPKIVDLLKLGLAGGSYVDLHYAILNLEDRLVIYEDEFGSLWVTPLLADVLQGRIIHPGRLFPNIEVDEPQSGLPWFNDVFLVSLLAYLLEEPDLFRSDGEMRKRAETELEGRFPHVFSGEDGRRRFSLTRTIIEGGDLATLDESRLLANPPAWRDIAELSKEARLCYCWANALETSGWGTDGASERLAGLLEALPEHRGFSGDALSHLIGFCARGEDPQPETALQTLVDLGLIVRVQDEWYCRNPHLADILAATHPEEPAAILQPNYELTVKPWVDVGTGLAIAYGADLLQFDTYPRFEITKTSVSRALATGFDAERLTQEIKALTLGILPQNIAFSIEDWAREYDSIQLYAGTVLVVDEARRHLVEHSQEVRSFVHRVLAPGVYLVRDGEGFEEALRSAGVELVPQVRRMTSSGRSPRRTSRSLRRFAPERLPFTVNGGAPPEQAQPVVAAADRGLEQTIDSASLPADVKDDLRMRLKRKLIVHPSQVATSSTRREKSEAKGLDYLGKVKLIQQTVSSKTHHLEVVARDHKGAPLRYLVRPEGVDKTGKELLLVGKTIPEGEEVSLAVSKLSLVRRLRGTFFDR